MKQQKETDPATMTEPADPNPLAVPEEQSEAEPEAAHEAAIEQSDKETMRQEFAENVQRILDLQLPITVSFGTARKALAEVLKLAPGSLVELDKSASDPVLLKVNNKVFAWGKVVDVDGYYGVEITEIIARADRIATLGG